MVASVPSGRLGVAFRRVGFHFGGPFDESKHPRDENGRFAPVATSSGKAAEGIADGLVGAGKASADDRDRIAKNWEAILDGFVADIDHPAIAAISEAQTANRQSEDWAAIEEKHGVPLVIPLTGDPDHPAFSFGPKNRGESVASGAASAVSADWAATAEPSEDFGAGADSVSDMEGLPGLLRHEAGHGLWDKISIETKNEWSDVLPHNDNGTLNFPKVRSDITGYAATRTDEAFCELLALRTSARWEASSFPPWVGEWGDRLVKELTA